MVSTRNERPEHFKTIEKAPDISNPNQGKIGEAIIRHLEMREGGTREELFRPDEVNRRTKDVDFVWRIGCQRFALEVTRIEPFAGLMKMAAEESRHFGPIKAALEHVVPCSETWQLHVPAKTLQGSKPGKTMRKIQQALIDWVKQTAPTLPKVPYGSNRKGIRQIEPPGVPFCVSLYRFQSPVENSIIRFIIKRSAPINGDDARRNHLRETCEKKFPKLAAWKRDKGARTVLVLEDNDMWITNQRIVAETLLPLAQARDDRADEIYLVSTHLGDKLWFAWPILVDNRSIYDLEGPNGQSVYWEIDPAELEAFDAA